MSEYFVNDCIKMSEFFCHSTGKTLGFITSLKIFQKIAIAEAEAVINQPTIHKFNQIVTQSDNSKRSLTGTNCRVFLAQVLLYHSQHACIIKYKFK